MIYSGAEADYIETYSAYMAARDGFYAGEVPAKKLIALRNAMDAAMAAAPFRFPCSDMARHFRALFYGGPFLTAWRGIPWEDVQ